MPAHEMKKFTFTTGDTSHTFANFCSIVSVWSPSEDFQVDYDQAISADSYLVPQNVHFAPPLACQEVHIKGSAAGGTAYLMGIFHNIGHAPSQPYTNRGGIDL